MSTFALRLVGEESLPSRLTEFDRELFFSLTAADVAAIREKFRSVNGPAAALQVLFLRALGRPMDSGATIPRSLLRYVAETFGSSSFTVASLRTLYGRRPTLYEHQLWSRKYLGIRDLDAAAEKELNAALAMLAAEASHPDELVVAACRWLYERRVLIPGQRRIQDWARDAFAAVEAKILEAIRGAVSVEALRKCRESVYCARPDDAMNHLEWLKTPPRRQAPSTLGELIQKIKYLKSLGVHEWALGGIALSKQRAYAQQLQARRPAKTRELRNARQTIELVCFLNVSLLEFTDVAVQQSNRRSQDLFRTAAQKADSARRQAGGALRQRAAEARDVRRDDGKSWRGRCTEALEILVVILESPGWQLPCTGPLGTDRRFFSDSRPPERNVRVRVS